MYKCLPNSCIDISDLEFPKGLARISAHKAPYSYEIAYSLFEKCNLKCKFCFQEHATPPDINVLREVPSRSFKASYDDLHKFTSVRRLHLLYIGGELFSDNISDEFFEEYLKMWNECRRLFKKEYKDIEFDFSICTNGIWKKKDRVIKLFKDGEINNVVVSYDPAGRYPTKEVEKEVRKSVVALKKAGFDITISFVLSKPNIQQYITKRKYLNYMQSDYIKHGDMNWYIGNPNWEEDLPSDDDVFEFYKWALDNSLFKIKFISLLMNAYVHRDKFRLEPNDRQCDCKYLLGMVGLKPTKNCIDRYSFFDNKFFYGNFADGVTEENVSDVKASLGIQKRGCLTCEYYNMCPMPCWSSVLFKELKAENCPVERAFNYINEAHIRAYKEFTGGLQVNG